MNKSQLRYYLLTVFFLTVGIVSVTLLFRWVLHEFSYDRFHRNGDRIYRLVSENLTTGNKWGGAVCKLREDLPLEVPQIEECVSVLSDGYSGDNPVTVRDMEDNNSFEVMSLTVSNNFFKVFTYPVAEGESGHVLQPNEVAISSEMAKKLYGSAALGKPLSHSFMGEEKMYNIAVVVDVPSNTHLPFDVVMPMSDFELNLYSSITESQPIYVKLKDNALFSRKDVQNLARIQIDKYDEPAKLSLQPLHDIHLHTDFTDRNSVGNRKASDVRIVIFGIILIVAITILNCATLDVSYSVRQTKNRVVKRVLGCSEGRILLDTIAETSGLTLVAIVLSILFIDLLMPAFQSWIGVYVTNGFDVKIGLFYLSILILLPLLSSLFGYYCLRSVVFTDVLKGKMRHLKGIRISDASSTIQVGISSLMAAFTVVIILQLAFMRNADKGLDLSNVVSINGLLNSSYKIESIRDELTKNPDVLSAGVCCGDMSESSGVTSDVEFPGKAEGNDIVFQKLTTDGYFMEMTDMQLVAGRFLNKNLDVDEYFDGAYYDNSEYVINESAAKAMGFSSDEAVGKELTVSYWGKGTIVGVVEDFRFSDMRNAVEPLIMGYYPEDMPSIMIKIAPENRQNTLAYIQNVMKDFSYSDVFSYSFLSEKELYSKEQQLSRLSLFYFLAAMILSLFGFYGVISYHLHQEAANMALRKVYGATTAEINRHYLKTKLRIYLFPVIIAMAVSYYIADRWLQGFAYHISSMSVVIIGVATLCVTFTLLALITSGVTGVVCNRRITDVLNR